MFADHEGFTDEHALTCEKMARGLRACCGRAGEASPYLQQALTLYKTYGAEILVDRVREEIDCCTNYSPCPARFTTGRGEKRGTNVGGRLSSGWHLPRITKDDMNVGRTLAKRP